MNSLSNELKVESIYHDCDSRQWIITLNNRQIVFSDNLSNIDNIIRYFINMQNGIIPFAKRVNFQMFSFTSRKDFKNSVSNDNGIVVFNSDSLVITYTNFNNSEYDYLDGMQDIVLFTIYTNNANDKVVNKAAKQLYSLFSSIYKYHYNKDYMKWYLYNYIYTNNYIDYMDNKYIEKGCF